MKVYYSIDEFAASGKGRNIVTTGTFDGVHSGHRKILEQVRQIANIKHFESTLLTFDPHPRQVLYPDSVKMFFLTTLDERIDLLEKAGIQNLIIHPFTKELSMVTALNYVREILVGKLKTDTLVIGYDHRFGYGRKGSIKELEEWGPVYDFNVEEVSPLKSDMLAISSSKIRKALHEGDLLTANNYLGYNFFIHARVVKGMQIGSKELGYPTANLEIDYLAKIIPADGIYAVYVDIGGQSSVVSHQSLPATFKYKGMMSIGMNPTIMNKGRSMEVHIFDFNRDIYGETIKVSFLKKIRNEEKFNTLAELKTQLDRDKEVCLGVL